jgi:hypothetical protein
MSEILGAFLNLLIHYNWHWQQKEWKQQTIANIASAKASNGAQIGTHKLGTYQCWVVLTFLWEPVGSASLMMLWETDQFSNI